MTTLHDLLRGGPAVAADATLGLIGLVEQMHATIGRRPGVIGAAPAASTRGVTGSVYGVLRGTTRVLGRGIGAALGAVGTWIPEGQPSPGLEAFVAVLNGVHGDYLERTANPLAVRMCWRQDGRPVDPATLAAAAVTRKVVVLVHGLCLNDLQWSRDGHDHGAALARDQGYTPLYLRYNSGLHISRNGQALAALLEDLVNRWPVPLDRLVILGHSMGGLVARSACHYGRLADHRWLHRLRSLVFLGTPHHGAPLERGGNALDFLLEFSPYSAPFTRLGRARSAGITDLRYGYLRDEDWRGRRRFGPGADGREPVPLPQGIACYAIAASLPKRRGLLAERLLGDGLVPLDSALGRHSRRELALPLPEAHQWVSYGTGHLDLLGSAAVYARLAAWVGDRTPPATTGRT